MIPITVRKIYKEDIALGEGVEEKQTYDGRIKTFHLFNASFIPLTTHTTNVLPGNPNNVEEALINLMGNIGNVNLSGEQFIMLHNLNTNVGSGETGSYGYKNQNCLLSKDSNKEVIGDEFATVKNSTYRLGGINPILAFTNIKIKEIWFYGVGARTHGEVVINPSYLTLQFFKVSIDDFSQQYYYHQFLGEYNIYVVIGQNNVLNIYNNMGGVVIGHNNNINLDINQWDIIGVAVKPQAAWNEENQRISLIDRLKVILKIEGLAF